jgi:predicted acylesterase/phospholipase RssA
MDFDLVFEGGGAKGIVFVGAMEAFTEAGHAFGRLMGTSAGAITATLLAAGYSAAEMQAAISEKENGRSVFEKFLATPEKFDDETIHNSVIRSLLRSVDLPLVPDWIEEKLDVYISTALLRWPLYRNLFSFIENGGLYSADHFVEWLRRKLDSGSYQGRPRRFSDMNFADFHAATGVDLTLIAADTSDQRILILNHQTAPRCPIVWATRMSMSIPLLWQEVIWQAEWGDYRGTPIAGNAIVDGGMLSNFPLELFVSKQPQVTAVMGKKENERVIGLLIDEATPVPGAPPLPAGQHEGGLPIGNLRSARRIGRLINTMLQAHDKMAVEAFQKLVARLPAGGYGTTEFNMSDERRAALVAAGKASMAGYLSQLAFGLPFDISQPVDMETVADNSALRILAE